MVGYSGAAFVTSDVTIAEYSMSLLSDTENVKTKHEIFFVMAII
jgi:hypothetical protein